MITASDMDIHHAAGVNHERAETHFFGFCIPEERRPGTVYTVVRAGLGDGVSEFIVYEGSRRTA